MVLEKVKENMNSYSSFLEYKKDIINKLLQREKGILSNVLENINPKDYINNPIQEIALDKIDNFPDSTYVTKSGLEQYAKSGTEPCDGSFHGIRFGKQIEIPIAVVLNKNGTFSILDGFHRAVQAFVNDDKNILAFVFGGSGKTLEEIFNSRNK